MIWCTKRHENDKKKVINYYEKQIDNLNESSKLRVSKVKMLDKINIPIMNDIKTKKDIFESSSSIFDSELNKFLLHSLLLP